MGKVVFCDLCVLCGVFEEKGDPVPMVGQKAVTAVLPLLQGVDRDLRAALGDHKPLEGGILGVALPQHVEHPPRDTKLRLTLVVIIGLFHGAGCMRFLG